MNVVSVQPRESPTQPPRVPHSVPAVQSPVGQSRPVTVRSVPQHLFHVVRGRWFLGQLTSGVGIGLLVARKLFRCS